MVGRRRTAVNALDLEPGDYMLTEDRTGLWIVVPTGARIRVPVREGEQDRRPLAEGGCWGFTEHDNGTLSLTPSLDVHGPDAWHGHLTAGQLTP